MKTATSTLIVGGNGKTGRRVAERLRARGLPFRLASRSSAPAFDWNDESTWASSLTGTRAAYITYAPDLAVPWAAEHVRRFVQRAVGAGVEKLVLLSGRGEPQVHPAEEAVRQSGVTFTLIETAFFAQNFSEGVLAPADGEIVFPAGNVAEPFVDADDIADVAVAALTEETHAGKTYELTGPRLLTFDEAAREIAAASGRPMRYRPVSSEAYAAVLAPYMPAPEVSFLVELFAYLTDGHNAHLADGVQRALGRPPRDFRDFARTAASGGAWVR
jgi:uncharacterized protein YbjT (DUF2867 family)